MNGARLALCGALVSASVDVDAVNQRKSTCKRLIPNFSAVRSGGGIVNFRKCGRSKGTSSVFIMQRC